MIILIYSESFYPALGGLERNSDILATALTDFGHDVILYTRTEACGIDPIKATPYKVVRGKSLIAPITLIIKADIVLINGGLSLKICIPAFILRRKYAPIFQMSTLYLRTGTGIKAKLYNSVSRFFVLKASTNITVSDYAKDRLGLLKIKAVSLINPVDPSLLKSIEDIKNNVRKIYDVLFAGRVIKGKGIFLLANALMIFKNRNGFYPVCAIAGEGDDELLFKAYCADNNIPVIFLGRLNGAKLIESYLSSKLLVVPSTTHVEGMPLVIAESITLGTPVIASNQPALVESVGQAGVTFPSGDADGLAKALEILLKDEGRIDEISQHVEAHAEKFSYQQYMQKLFEIIKSLS